MSDGSVNDNLRFAFQCRVCPRNDDPSKGPACPAWWTVIQTQVNTEEQRVLADCAFRLMPLYFTESFAAANRAAASADAVRNVQTSTNTLLTKFIVALQEAAAVQQQLTMEQKALPARKRKPSNV